MRQLPDASHVSLSQRVWWRFRWQVGRVSAAFFFFFFLLKEVLQWQWHSKLILLAPNLNGAWASHLHIKRLNYETKISFISVLMRIQKYWVFHYSLIMNMLFWQSYLHMKVSQVCWPLRSWGLWSCSKSPQLWLVLSCSGCSNAQSPFF